MTEDEQEQTPDPAPEPVPGPRKRRRGLRFAARLMFLASLMPFVFAAAAGIMLIGQDITAPSWVKERIEARAALMLDGGSLKFGAITLRIDRDLHPTVRLVDTQLYDASGLTIARVPMVEGLVSPRGLILRQDLLVQQIRLSGAQINLRRASNGSFAIAFGNETGPVGQAGSLPDLLDQVDGFLARPALEALETVSADGLIVNFDDARAGRSWIVDGGTLGIDLRRGQVAIRSDLALLSGRADVTTVALSYDSPRDSRRATLALNIDNAVASDIAAQSPALSWLRDIDAPISAALRTALDDAGALGPLSATLEIGAGVLQPNPATSPIAFESAKAYLTFDPVLDRIAFNQVALATDWGNVRFDGAAFLRDFENGLPRTLLAQFRVREGAINPASLYEAPLILPDATVDMRLRFDPFRLDIGQFVLVDGPSRLRGKGEIAATEAGWQVALDASLNEIAPARLLEFWPVSIKPGTRLWLNNNLTEGRLFGLAAGWRKAPGAAANLAAGFEFADATVRFMRTMPPIVGGHGVATFQDRRFVVSLDEGHVAAPEGGQLDMAGSVFAIPDARVRQAPATLDLRISSGVTAALSILNQPPFTFLDKANLPVTLADGRAKVAGHIDLRLKPRMTPDELRFDFAADLSGVRSDVLIPGRQLSAAAVQVTADREGLTIAGPIRVGEVPLTGTFTRRFGPASGGQGTVEATVELSQQFLDEFGIALPPGSIGGTGQGQLTLTLKAGEPTAFSLRSDLRGLTVALPPIGWAKGRNTEGSLLVEGTLGPVPTISNLVISGGGLRAQGRIEMAADGTLGAARFTRVQVGDWLDAPITLRGRGRGQPVGVEIGGGLLDLRRARFGARQAEGGPIQIALDRLQITEGIALTGFRGDFTGAGGFQGQFRGQVNGATVVQGSVAPRNGRSAVRVVSDDAGGVARDAGFLRNAVGGSLDLTLLPGGAEGTFDGVLAVRRLRVRDAPAIAALLDAISVVGLLQQLDGQGLAFDEVDARFRLNPEQVILTEASAVGPGLGISLDGTYTLATKQVDFQGVVSPFYLLNSIGSFLTRKGEGLIGFNFNIAGSSAAPQVSVNPLSALTPGMFREIFRRPPPQVSE